MCQCQRACLGRGGGVGLRGGVGLPAGGIRASQGTFSSLDTSRGNCVFRVAETKVTAQLICAFVFAYTKV